MLKSLLSLVLVTLTTLVSLPAQAATARLISCDKGVSVSGAWVYVGTYATGFGAQFELVFASGCPFTVEV